ncbi:hypothetical protein ABIB94_007172 [Bradyrhizobium sp. JR7.2]|uniref:hypothetical protein n=1 Tax=unclassified Bradyrhizobium TaxID=2631580 RepID=UPI0033964D5F
METTPDGDENEQRPERLPEFPQGIRVVTLVPDAPPLSSVHFYTFAAERKLSRSVSAPNFGAFRTLSKNHYHAREAAATLLKMAKATSDPAVAAGLIGAASKLKDEAGELSPPVTFQAPDVYPDDVQPKKD